ncbi:MAG TPA: CHAP domain-containing protein [Anaeromyxobacteraceae bacterium]|nr:CHAP domain-containing protein [Anaeromyxobacteraceae bacterium]
MAASRRLGAWMALGLASCAGANATSRSTLPPPAGDGRVGSRYERGADPALASAEAPRPEVRRAVDTAESLVGRRSVVVDGRDYGPDCTALVRAAFDQAGHPLPAAARDVSSIHAVAERRGTIHAGLKSFPGDVVFLADRPGGPPAHVGLVARVELDGTAIVLYRLARGVARVRVNLGYPTRIADPATGRRLNDTLLVGSSAVPAGSLVVGVASLL